MAARRSSYLDSSGWRHVRLSSLPRGTPMCRVPSRPCVSASPTTSSEDHLITLDDLSDNMVKLPAGPERTASAGPLDLRELECRHVWDVLQKMQGNKVQAARALGISRRAFYRLIEKHGLDRTEVRTPPADANTTS